MSFDSFPCFSPATPFSRGVSKETETAGTTTRKPFGPLCLTFFFPLFLGILPGRRVCSPTMATRWQANGAQFCASELARIVRRLWPHCPAEAATEWLRRVEDRQAARGTAPRREQLLPVFLQWYVTRGVLRRRGWRVSRKRVHRAMRALVASHEKFLLARPRSGPRARGLVRETVCRWVHTLRNSGQGSDRRGLLHWWMLLATSTVCGSAAAVRTALAELQTLATAAPSLIGTLPPATVAWEAAVPSTRLWVTIQATS